VRLVAAGVTVRYGARVALDGVDVSVEPGEILGVIGPNGSGKSTLVRVLAGLRAADAGSVQIDGVPLPALSRRERGRRIALVPQETHVTFPMRVRDLVLLGRAAHLGPFGWEKAHDLRAAHEAMARTEVLELADRPIDTLSGGERQRVVLARALAQEPQALLLDEPTSFLDLRHAVELCDLVRELCRARRLAVVLVLHDLNLAGMYCDRLLLLCRGRAHVCGAPAQVLNYEDLCAVYETDLYVAPNDVTGTLVVLPLSRDFRERLASQRRSETR
jgi:iron complex transport system ATP-binding protein